MCIELLPSRFIRIVISLFCGALISGCSPSDFSAIEFQSSLSCGMEYEEVTELVEKLGGKFEKGISELDYNSVYFDQDHGYFLIISDDKGLIYGASTHVNLNSGGEFLCCKGIPKCEGNETNT